MSRCIRFTQPKMEFLQQLCLLVILAVLGVNGQEACQVKMLMAAEHWARPLWEEAYPAAFGAENVEFFYARGDLYKPENDDFAALPGVMSEVEIIDAWQTMVDENPDTKYCFAVQRSCTWMDFCDSQAMDELWIDWITRGHKTAFSMSPVNMNAATNITGRLANEDTCFDEDSFEDAHGYGCSDWENSDCEDASQERDSEQYTYTSENLTSVQDNCRKACGICKRITAVAFMVDNYVGSMQMAELFCKQPHPPQKRKFITYGNDGGECRLRLSGFVDGVAQICPEKAELKKEVVVGGWSSVVAKDVAAEVWAIFPDVSAVMACWDGAAIAFIESAREKRVQGMTDLYIMGVDNATAAWPYLESGELFATFDQQFTTHDRGIIAQMKKFFETDFNYEISGIKFDPETATGVAIQTRDMADYIYNNIFSTYDKSVPDLSNNGQLDIQVDLDGYVLDIEILTQEFHLVTNLRVMWMDTRLQWDSNQFGGVLFPAMEDIFIPNVDFSLRSEQYFKLLDNPSIELHSDGTVVMEVKEFNGFYCLFDISDFPFDVHHCHIDVISRTTGANVIVNSASSNAFARDFYNDITVKASKKGWDVLIVHDPMPLHISVAIPSWFLTILTFFLYYINEPTLDRGGITMVAILSTLQLVLLYRNQTEGKSCWLMTFNAVMMVFQCMVCVSLLLAYVNHRMNYSRLIIIPSFFVVSISLWLSPLGTESYKMRAAEMTFLILANLVGFVVFMLVEYMSATGSLSNVQGMSLMDGVMVQKGHNDHPFSGVLGTFNDQSLVSDDQPDAETQN